MTPDSEAHRINHGITFDIGDTVMSKAASKVAKQYTRGRYIVTIRDCVSFSAGVARYCGLKVFPVNMTPFGLVQSLALWNDYVRKW